MCSAACWRQIEAAHYDAQAVAAARDLVQVAVISDVARAYVDLRGLQMQLAVAAAKPAGRDRTC